MSTEFQKPISSTINANNQSVDLTNPNASLQTIQLSGTWVGTLVIEASNDGVTYLSLPIYNESTKALVSSMTTNGFYSSSTNGFQFFRIRSSAWTSGTVNFTVYGSDAASNIQGSFTLRSVDGNNATIRNSAPVGSDFGIIVRPVTLELPTFSILASAIAIANNKSMLAIQNTGTSVVRIREVWIINDRTTPVTGIAGIFQVTRIASFTGGTTVLPVTFDTADTLPSGITASTGATVSGESDILRQGVWSTDEWGPGTLDTEGLDHALQQIEPFWKQTPNGKALTIRQNQGIHVKFATNSTAGDFNIRIVFTVE